MQVFLGYKILHRVYHRISLFAISENKITLENGDQTVILFVYY